MEFGDDWDPYKSRQKSDTEKGRKRGTRSTCCGAYKLVHHKRLRRNQWRELLDGHSERAANTEQPIVKRPVALSALYGKRLAQRREQLLLGPGMIPAIVKPQQSSGSYCVAPQSIGEHNAVTSEPRHLRYGFDEFAIIEMMRDRDAYSPIHRLVLKPYLGCRSQDAFRSRHLAMQPRQLRWVVIDGPIGSRAWKAPRKIPRPSPHV